MRRTILILTAMFFAFAAPAASAQVFTVIGRAHVRPAELAKVERAVVAQSAQLRDWWGTPLATFGPGGWPVYLDEAGWNLHYGPDSSGMWATPCDDQPTPCALVSPDWNGATPWTVLFSHEVLETLADPGNQGDEVCDPAGYSYRLRGVWVQDFVTPAWFTGAPGPFDQLRLLRHAGQVYGSGS